MNGQNKYYDVEEIAYLYGVKVGTVLKWIREGKLNAVLIDGDWNDKGRTVNVHSYGILSSDLDDFDPMVGWQALCHIERASRKQETRAYMDWLDERSEQLNKEIEFINQMKEYVRRNEPYF